MKSLVKFYKLLGDFILLTRLGMLPQILLFLMSQNWCRMSF